MRFWFVSPDGTTTIFSRDAADYKLLKKYSGLAEVPVAFQTDKSPYQHGTTLLPDGCLMTEREVSFDILIMAPAVGDVISVIGASENTTSVFGDALFGDMIFGNGDTYSEGTTTIYSANLDGLQKRIAALSRALSPIDGPGTLYYEREDGTTYRLTCSWNGQPFLDVSDKGRSDVHQLATLVFTAHDPFWYSGTPNLESFGVSSTSFFPFAIPWSIHRGSSSRKSLLNAGNASAPVNISIWGPVTDPVMTNNTTVEAITLDLAMVAGDRFDITTGQNKITALYTPVSTGVPVNGQGYITVGSKFWVLKKGMNDISFSCATSAAGSGASVSWSDQYAGVF